MQDNSALTVYEVFSVRSPEVAVTVTKQSPASNSSAVYHDTPLCELRISTKPQLLDIYV